MGGCGSFGLESDFLRVISGANLLINNLDGPCKVSGKSGTSVMMRKTQVNPFGISAKNSRRFKRP
jgi:hypothetical protein